jgi:hypothetical protein
VSKRCEARGCTTQIPNHLLMCRPHWSDVPTAIQAEVYRTWRVCQRGITAAGWEAYLAAVEKARDAVSPVHSASGDQ